MLHRWPEIRAYMGPEFLKLLDWITFQRGAMADRMEEMAASDSVRSDLAAIEARGMTSIFDGSRPDVEMAAVLARGDAT